jgi:hypothetical protein
MFEGANNALSTEVYDAALIYWDSLTLKPNVVAHFGDATYSTGSAAAARANIIADHNWAISDGGEAA